MIKKLTLLLLFSVFFPMIYGQNEFYSNPVFEPDLADPTVIKANGWFYAYGTENNWGDKKENHLIPIVRSTDLVHWEYVGDAFTGKPEWKNPGFIWAPEIAKVGKSYHLYYAYSLWGDPDPGIGLATASQPEGPFFDQGKLFLSSEVNVPNSIDPFYMEDHEKKYLFWGSFNDSPTQGIYVVELSADGRSVPDLKKKIKIAAGDFEAVMIHKRNGYYYFFGSKGSCCDGNNSQYKVYVGRSKSLFGPYKDKLNHLLTERDSGTLILEGNEKFAGPGHNSRIITDDAGTDWLLYHAVVKEKPFLIGNSGATRRPLMLDKIIWKDGWPEIEGKSPSVMKIKVPLFKIHEISQLTLITHEK